MLHILENPEGDNLYVENWHQRILIKFWAINNIDSFKSWWGLALVAAPMDTTLRDSSLNNTSRLKHRTSSFKEVTHGMVGSGGGKYRLEEILVV